MTAARHEHWHAATYFEWMNVFRDFPAPPAVKLTGYALASYCTYSTGNDAHPGLDLLLQATGYTSKQTIVTALATLRRLGLIVRAVNGSANGRRGLADEYYLALDNAARREAGKRLCNCKPGATAA